MKKLICYNCGREIEENAIQCQFCNAILAPHTCMIALEIRQ
ncbi:MAG: hypothetical protein AB1779_06080 [Candidatus Thermoplasmatota archaeon]